MSIGPLRIVLLYDCVYPESVGGVEKRNAELATALVARGHRVVIAGPTRSPGQRPEGYEVVDLSRGRSLPWRNTRRRLSDVLRYRNWVAHFDTSGFDVLETANIPYGHLLPLRAAQRVPWVVTWHEYWGEAWRHNLRSPIWPLYRAFERAAAKWGTRAVAPSRLTAERVAAARGRPVDLVPGGVWTDQLARIGHHARSVPAKDALLITANRLIPDKRTDLLLRAVAAMPRLPGEVAGRPLLDIIGDGIDRPRLEALTGELGIAGRVRFRGYLPSSVDLWRSIASADLAVQPSGREGFGLFPLEALALGVPVVHVTSNESAVAEIVRHGIEGLAVAPEPEALASALAGLLRDAPRRQAMAEAAARRAQDYDWSAIAGRLENALRAAIYEVHGTSMGGRKRRVVHKE